MRPARRLQARPPCGSRCRAGRMQGYGSNSDVIRRWQRKLFSYFCLTANVQRAMARILLRTIALAALFMNLSGALPASQAEAQTAGPLQIPLQISWEVRNRFRLFREERDFLLHVDAGRGRTVLASEQALGIQSDGRGWARNTVGRLCIDVNGRVSEPCTRDNVKESYLTPLDHPVTLRLTGTVPVGATCAWTVDDGDGPTASTFDCAEPVNM